MSRDTLKRWDDGDFAGKDATFERCLAWLSQQEAGPSYADAAMEAARIVEEALEKIRAMAPVDPSALREGATGAVRAAKQVAKRSGKKEASGEE